MEINKIANEAFEGKIVRKDLVSKIKGGANVPVYVLEYLLGMYCNNVDEDSITEGMEKVKKILAENYVRPDEAEKVKSKIKEIGSYTVIDKVSVKLNEKKDRYEGELSNLGSLPPDILSDMQLIFYQDPIDAVQKALGFM